MLTSLCFSQLKGVPGQPDSSSFQAETHNEVCELWVVCLLHHLSSSVPPPRFAPTCPSSYVSMHRSLRRVCVLSRESFGELQLFKSFKFQQNEKTIHVRNRLTVRLKPPTQMQDAWQVLLITRTGLHLSRVWCLPSSPCGYAA